MSYPTDFFMKHARGNAYLDPVHHWLVLFIASVLAFIIIVVWNVWTFNIAARGDAIGAPPVEAPPVFNRSSLDSINAVFASRASEEAKYVTGVYHFADPSQ